MDYIRTEPDGQLVFPQTDDYLMIPSRLINFMNSHTSVKHTESGQEIFCFEGTLNSKEQDITCSCGAKMHINGHPSICLRHVPFGESLSVVEFQRNQYVCPVCGETRMQDIPFRAPGHRITGQLYDYVCWLLSRGSTNKWIADMTGLNKNTVKAIDKERLQNLYTDSDGNLVKPENYARHLGIDEFKLHNGYRYATHIIDLETGHILWIAEGKKKQVVYDFIEHVGMEWMSHVEAVACDMNSDFQEAFQEKCPHIRVVFDHFHIVKNFNDKVINEVRKDEQRRLIEEGNLEGARLLKNSRFILTSNRSTLERKDKEAEEGHVIRKGSSLFKTEDVVRKGGNVERCDKLLQENELLLTTALIKDKLDVAYKRKSETLMAQDINEITDLCDASGNKHLQWFAKLLRSHFDGVIAHATYKLSSGKIEGINNKIKTLRRQGYGYPDDEYFFLKLLDMSRENCVKKPSSHKKSD